MNKKISICNGYPVHGDTKELDLMVSSPKMITLDKDDIVNVLSAEGKNYVTSGVSTNIADAFQEAVNNLPYKIDNVNKLIVEFICGSKSPSDNDLAAISSFLSDSNSNLELRWGLTSDESLGESHKVVLLASISVKKNI